MSTEVHSIHISDVVKRYRDVRALQGVSVTVTRGEIFGILGPNGAGKTTLVEILSGLRTADGGTISVLGLDPAQARDRRELMKRVGIVSQHAAHYRFLTVRELVEMYAGYYPVAADIDALLAQVGLTECQSQRIRKLSGGQQRRLDVAVALVGNPELVFLDEPTTGFDPNARRDFWETIRGIRDAGTTVILTTHYMEEAQYLADRVAVLVAGKVKALGTAHELSSVLKLQSRISCVLPAEIDTAIIPALDTAKVAFKNGELVVHTTEPTAVLAVLCTWANGLGIELHQLVVARPSLEDAYIALTDTVHEPRIAVPV